MIAFVIVIAIAAAAVGGYAFGARLRTATSSVDRESRLPDAAPALVRVTTDETPFGAEKARIIRSLDCEAAALRSLLAKNDTLRIDDAQFRQEREQMFVALADARADSARYRQLVIDIENNAPPPILSGIGEPDDLKMIVGIGPVLERMLHSLRVTTFRQIARWTPRDVVEFDTRLPEFPGRIQRDQWVTQASALHQSKYGARPTDS